MKTASGICRRFQPRSWTALLLVFCAAVGANTCADTASPFRILHDFARGEGSGGLILSGSTLYGTGYSGGASNLGILFKLKTDGNGFEVLKDFRGTDGANPSSYLQLINDTLYGTTYHGGISNCGTVFKIHTNGTSFTVLKEFLGSDGKSPAGALVLSGPRIYGSTYNGGFSDYGTLFQVETNGASFEVIKYFTGTMPDAATTGDGAYPSGGLVLFGPALYGATVWGGPNHGGVIFRVNLDGSEYTILKTGNVTEGGHYSRGLVAAGDTLFGTTPYGGGGIGCLFSLKMNGTDYRILHSFTGFDGVNTACPIISDSLILGTAYQGGISNCGVVYGMEMNGNRFTLLWEFDGVQIAGPTGLVANGNRVYGTTSDWGQTVTGKVYELNFAPAITEAPASQTAEIGKRVHLRSKAQGVGPMGYQWVFNGVEPLGGNTNSLLWTSIQPSNSGTYWVVVTNPLVAVTSAPAALAVVASVPKEMEPGLILSGQSGSVVNLEACATMPPSSGWATLASLTMAGTSQYFFEDLVAVPSQRYFRAWQTNSSGQPPAVNIHLYPTITLTGAVGSVLRVDAINQMGPVTSWFPLATITLTNPVQRYHDITAPDQPPRVYRLMPVP
jgi:uncharacterized repeat protein (TIGR03803 family)